MTMDRILPVGGLGPKAGTDISTAAVDRRRIYIDRDKVFHPGNTWAIVAGLYPHGYVQEESYLAMTADRDRLAAEVARLTEALEFGVGLIRGDAVGSEWKKGCAEFIKRAHAARREGEA